MTVQRILLYLALTFLCGCGCCLKKERKTIKEEGICLNLSNTTPSIQAYKNAGMLMHGGAGHYTGLSMATYDNGALFYAKMYVDGQLHGLDIEVDPDGRIQKFLTYKNGVLDGIYVIYNSKGGVDFVEHYKKGEVLNRFGPGEEQLY